jgi:hypothetical protein
MHHTTRDVEWEGGREQIEGRGNGSKHTREG